MSFDLHKLVEALLLPKVKSRNDALNALARFSPAKLRLSARHFAALTGGLIKCIEIERDIYTHNAANAVAARAQGASTFLREVLHVALKSQHTRYKLCLPIGNGIIANYFMGSDRVFDACSLDLAHMLHALLAERFYFSHMNAEVWLKCYRFVVRAIGVELDACNDQVYAQGTLHHLLEALLLLVGGQTPASIVPLLQNRTYFPLLRLLKSVARLSRKRESPALIVAFKIVNKLVPVLATEDFAFAHELIALGVTTFLHFEATSVDPLLEQFSVFLNLDAFHRFLSIENLPRLLGDHEGILSEDETDTSDSPTQKTDLVLYNVGMLIQALIQRFQLLPNLQPEDIDFQPGHSNYQLAHVRLKTKNHASWQATRGLARLIDSYYNLRSQHTNNVELLSFIGPSTATNNTRPTKRQKLQDQRTKLWSCNSAVQFLDSLICDHDLRTQTTGLQLLIFYYELRSRRIEPLEKHKSFVDANVSATCNFYDSTTVLDVAFFGNGSTDSDENILLGNVVKAIANKHTSFWAATCSLSILNKSDIQASLDRPFITKKIHQLMKLVTPLIKDKSLSAPACNLFVHIVFSQTDASLVKLVDRDILTQLENITDLSDIAGPALVNDLAIAFWWALAKVFATTGNLKRVDVGAGFARWLLEKWSLSFDSNGSPSVSPQMLAKTTLWLGGKLTNNIPTEVKLSATIQDNEPLQRFIALDMECSPSAPLLMLEPSHIGTSPNQLRRVIEKVCDLSTIMHQSEASLEQVCVWASFYMHMLKIAEGKLSEAAVPLANKAKDLIMTLHTDTRLRSDAYLVVSTILQQHPPRDLLTDFDFPFEVVDFHYQVLTTRATSFTKELSMDPDLDSEFLSSESTLKGSVVESDIERLDSIDHLSYLKFRILFRSNGPKDHVRMLQECSSPETMLLGLQFYMEYLQLQNVHIDPHDLSALIRLIGEGPLSSHMIDRSDLTIEVACYYLSLLFPLINEVEALDLERDVTELMKFLTQCFDKKMLLSSASQLNVSKLNFLFTKFNTETTVSNTAIVSGGLEAISDFPNELKFNMCGPIHDYISDLDIPRRMLFYKEIFAAFSDPQSSVEKSATYCYFFAEFTRDQLQLKLCALFNLLECAKWEFFHPYLKQSIALMAMSSGLHGPKNLFIKFKVELFKCWWTCGLDILAFPFDFFGYEDKRTFLVENYRSIVSVSIAIKPADSQTDYCKLLDHLAQAKLSNRQSLVKDSLPTVVPLAYTSDGVRNDIFKILASLLKDEYKVCMRTKLIITILEVLKITDVKSEPLLQAALGQQSYFESDEILDISLQSLISPTSSTDLCKALIAKFWDLLSKPFWSVQTVYFLIRRLGIGTSDESSHAQRGSLRRIKLVLGLSGLGIENFKLFRILCEILSSLDDTRSLDELLPVFSHVQLSKFESVPPKSLLKAILPVIDKLTRSVEKAKLTHSNFIHALESAHHFGFGKSSSILQGIIDYIKGDTPTIVASDVEGFLENFLCADFEKWSPTVFSILSTLFEFVVPASPVTLTRQKLVDSLTKFPIKGSISDKFRLWIAEYLAAHYLAGKVHNQLDLMLELKEYDEFDKNTFSEDYKTLNPMLNLLIEETRAGSYESAAFAESILGTMIWRYESKKEDVSKLLDFECFYSQAHSYLTPIDFHSCMLVNSDNDEIQFETVPLDNFIANLPNSITESSFVEWASRLLLSIIHEVAAYTTLAPLFASCIIKLPKLAQDALPSLICFYIFASSGRAGEKIRNLLSAIWRCFRPSMEKDAIDLIKNIVLSIRIGSKLGVSAFADLYSSLDYENLFMMIKEGWPKSALLIFEDSLDSNAQNIDSFAHTSALADIYLSLDEDYLSGLPEDKTLENSLKMIEKFASPSERVRYGSGLLDASMTLGLPYKSELIVQSTLGEGLLGVSKFLSEAPDSPQNTRWAWKLNQWDQPPQMEATLKDDVIYSYFKQIKDNPSTHNTIYESAMLRTMSQKDFVTKQHSDLSFALKNWYETLAVIVSSRSIFKTDLNHFQSEIENFEARTNWFDSAESQFFEDILQARRTAFQIYGKDILGTKNQFLGEFAHLSQVKTSPNSDLCWLGEAYEIKRYNDLLRNDGEMLKAVSSTILLDQFVNTVDFSKMEDEAHLKRISTFQAAQTLWSQGKTSISVSMLKELGNSGSITPTLRPLHISELLINALLVKWMASSRLELGTNILSQIVDPMSSYVDGVEDLRQRAKVYHLLAAFCDSQFKSKGLKEQIQELETRVKSRRHEIEEIKSHYGRTSVPSSEKKAVQKYYTRLKNQVSSETAQLESLRQVKGTFASKALIFYLNVLLVNEREDDDMDKFFALFLELSGDDALQASIKYSLRSLSTVKALPWLTQLLSRLSTVTSNFQEAVQTLVERICFEHPFHSLYFLFSLIFHRNIADETNNIGMLSRIDAAASIQDRLKSSDANFASTILQPIEKLCLESVVLAETKSARGKSLHLDKLKVGSYWLSHLPKVPPPAISLPVSRNGYDNVPVMVTIDPIVTIAASGLSLPKIATFTLSDGHTHKTLFKHGTDDLRQDAIMEEVFEKVNKILSRDSETRKRRLRVRTYRAVPLGPKAGVIEFVPHSMALIDVIKPLHQKQDSMKSEKAREMMKECQTNEMLQRIAVYKKITDKVHPVLRYFFMSNFVTPDDWFASRNIYTRGVASTSMVGHILGLGDRHCNNILLDEFTGEPIHIDLGVAFDQGKRLPIPETVPFRLTRDIVDGLGFTGTLGSFSKLCEHTFRVLQANKDHILAILDVLRWDPLYSWSISPIRMKKLQDGSTAAPDLEPQEDGSEAGTSVLTVSEKLQAGGLSVEATVRDLIREATSEPNLAAIYCGWCPFF